MEKIGETRFVVWWFDVTNKIFTNHNQCKKDLRKSGESKEKDIHSYYAMVWASLAAKKQQQKLD